jgi:hypothetical protein
MLGANQSQRDAAATALTMRCGELSDPRYETMIGQHRVELWPSGSKYFTMLKETVQIGGGDELRRERFERRPHILNIIPVRGRRQRICRPMCMDGNWPRKE